MSKLLLVPLALMTACAPATGGGLAVPPTGPSQVIHASGRATSVGSGEEAFAAAKRFGAARAPVWSALLASHADLGIPLNAVDASEGRTVARLALNGSLLDEPVSRFLTCGGTAGVSELADHFQVEVYLRTVLTSPRPGVTDVELMLTGLARDRFSNTAPRRCLTRGVLEERLASRVRERLGLAPSPTAPAEAATERIAPLVERRPGVEQLPRGEPVRPSHPLLLTAGGAAAGGVGTLIGAQLGADCEKRCIDARGLLGPLVVNSVLIPLGTHALNRGRGSLVQSFMVSAGWAAAGAVLAGFTDENWPVYAVAPAQLITSVWIERASSR